MGIVSSTARLIGLFAALAMLLFSAWIYLRTSDWVALIFILGSLGYIVLFVSSGKGGAK
ncbi:MAG: hypothetical protein Hals2KO_02650 [Halioglobus sp.]